MRTIQKMLLGLAACGLAAWVFTGCQTVSETGRSQLILMSAGEETQLGITSFDQLKKEVPISKDAAANAMLQRVGQRIAAVATLPNAQWEFVLFQSEEANAFCLPGGKVGVYTGILGITANEAGLATVLGHEVAHAVARHGAERMSEAMAIEGLGSLLGSAVNAYDPRWQELAGTMYGVGTKVGRELPHSRAQESEADRIGLRYMARAGYNPEEAVAFWERFAQYNKSHGGDSTPGFLRTHPLDNKRINDLKAWLPEAKAQMQPAR